MSNGLPKPFAVRPSGEFEGNDGAWSTFLIAVGNPIQNFRALVSTSSFSTWLPTSDGCVYEPDPSFVPDNCPSLRGIGLKNGFQSSGFDDANGTFEYIGIHTLDLGNDLSLTETFGSQYNATANLGLDTLALQNGAGSEELSPEGDVPIFGLSTWNFFLPSLGLGVGYLQSTTQETASLVQQLANQSLISSSAWSYTAGASYREYTGSLVLGGYDDTRIEANSTTQYALPPSTDITQLRLSLASIAFSFNNGTEASVPVSENVVIDSTLPYLYLPSGVCDELASRLGLTYNEPADIFTIDSAALAANKENIQQVRITVGDTENSGNTTSITFPYAAFDLNATWPTYDQGQSQPYFPIRRASSDTYILGRAFLQEAHLSVDWERAYFNLSQAAFPDTRTEPNLIPIYNISIVQDGTALSAAQRTSPSNGLGGGAIAGLVIGVIAAVALIVGLVFFFCIRRKRREPDSEDEKRVESDSSPIVQRKESGFLPSFSERDPNSPTGTYSSHDPISPIDGSFLHVRRVNELSTDSPQDTRAGVNVLPGIHEVADNQRQMSEVDGYSDTKSPLSPTQTHHSSEKSQQYHSSPASQQHSSPRSELEA